MKNVKKGDKGGEERVEKGGKVRKRGETVGNWGKLRKRDKKD